MQDQTLAALLKVCSDLQKVAGAIRIETDAVVSTQDHIEIIRHFDNTRRAVENIKDSREVIQELSDRLSREFIPDIFRAKSLKTITIEGIGRVTVSNKFSASMLDKERGFQWLRDTGNGGIIQETVNSSTLAAFAKELVVTQNKELPPDIFKVGTTPNTSITKVK